MTAESKKDGRVRRIATGTSFRRLVAKSLARQFGAEVETVCATFQFGEKSKKEGFLFSRNQDPVVFRVKSDAYEMRKTKIFHLLGPCQQEDPIW